MIYAEPERTIQKDRTPLVSVVIPTYNSAGYIGETLESVLNQDYPRIEVLVVDDGSTDNTRSVVKSFSEKRVVYLYQHNSGGPSGPRNKGIHAAKGRYIAFIDSDDIMLSGKINRAVAMLYQQPELGLVFTNFVKFDETHGQYPGAHLDTYESLRATPKKQVAESQYVIKSDCAYDCLISENYIGTSSVVVPKEVFSRVGCFDESIAGPEDFDMWLRITSLYDIGFIDMIGHRYRVREGSITMRGDKSLIPHKLRILRKQLEKDLPVPVRKKIRKKLAGELSALGYCHQTDGEMRLARQHYLLSLKEARSRLACKGLLMTFLGTRSMRLLKYWRDRLTGNIEARNQCQTL